MFDCADVEMRELLPALAAGTLDDATRPRVERHVASCAECASEARDAPSRAIGLRGKTDCRCRADRRGPAEASAARGACAWWPRRQAMDRLASRGGPNDDLGRRPLARGGAPWSRNRLRGFPLLHFHLSTPSPAPDEKRGADTRRLALTIPRGPSIGPVVHPPLLGRKRSSRLPAARMSWTTYRSRRCLARSTRSIARRWLRPKSRIPRRCCQ